VNFPATSITSEDLLLVSDRPLIAAMNPRWDEAAILLCQEQDGLKSPFAQRCEWRPGEAPAPFTAILGGSVPLTRRRQRSISP